MRVEAKKHLHDINQAADLLTRLVSARSLTDFENDAMLRSAVERQFEIIGEALAQLARLDAALAERITECRRIIGFRNILIHGYAEVDPRMVWDIIETKLPRLRLEIGGS
ncbi:MAG: HepT-like ribonuclease domain-containing protein [Candidatus Bipolaricaulota bacterium]